MLASFGGGCPRYDTKLHLVVRLQFWAVWSTSSLLLLSGPLWLGVIIPVRIPSMGQIELFKNYLYSIGIVWRKISWTPSYGRAKAGRPARTYIQQLCEDTGCSPEDLPGAMNDREEWRERVSDIRAGGTTWGWWWLRIIISYLKTYNCVPKYDYY